LGVTSGLAVEDGVGQALDAIGQLDPQLPLLGPDRLHLGGGTECLRVRVAELMQLVLRSGRAVLAVVTGPSRPSATLG
jgi:hypothetical protein